MNMDHVVDAARGAGAALEIGAEPELPLEVRRVRLEPGDILVLKSKQRLSHEICTRLTEALKRDFPGVPIMILDPDMDLEVVSPAKPKAA